MKWLKILLVLSYTYAASGIALAQEPWTESGLDNLYISKIITTPYGVLSAEFDSRIWLNPTPYNGIRISKDMGTTWNYLGLEKTGVTDITFEDNTIYAATYYTGAEYKNGMYYSNDKGETWHYGGFGKSANKIYAHNGVVYLAGIGRGLWITTNLGETWEIKVGEQNSDYEITGLAGKEGVMITSTTQHTYISTNDGKSWEIIQDLEANTIIDISFGENSIMAIGRENKIFRSLDGGQSWQKIQENSNLQPEKIIYFENSYYLGQRNLSNYTFDVYKTSDLGNSWQQTNLNKTQLVASLTGIYSFPSLILAFIQTDGLYKQSIDNTQEVYPFLQIPWETNNKSELTARIYSYFDHRYPLLGYSYNKESEENSATTLNYLGIEQEIPDMYYSSHDGYDFSLPYGKEILAAYEGLAEYYYCEPCGNTIKITHPNGYQTTYMHLQKDNLVTASSKWVNTGEIIGKVGMTGNTTGPHLHFAVTKSEAYPDGRTDPFGWQSKTIMDPWNNYFWEDLLGVHVGSKSVYLWEDSENVSSDYLQNQEVTVALDNKKVGVPAESIDSPVTIILKTGSMPHIPQTQKSLSYIWDTAMLLDAWDNLGNHIENLSDLATIEIDLPATIAGNIIKESLKIYFWNEINDVWMPLETVYDELANKLIAQTLHFSNFAVFEEKLDPYTPKTSVLIEGNTINNWYVEYPIISLATQNPNDTTFYTTKGEYWDEYTKPFILENEGISTISYRSVSENGNLEDTQYAVLKINTESNFVDTAVIENSFFITL